MPWLRVAGPRDLTSALAGKAVPMNALVVINGLGTGGAERSLVEFLTAVSDQVTPIVVCLNRRVEGVQDTAMSQGLDVRFVRSHSLGGWVRALRRLIHQEQPDLLHTTIFEADVAGRLAAAGSRVPVLTSLVSTPYDPVRLEDPAVRAWKLRAVQTIDGWTARQLTTHFHAITDAVKITAVRHLRIAPTRVTVIERGRDPERLGEPSPDRRAHARAGLGLNDDPFVLLSIGRQEFAKGQSYLLEALPSLVKRVPGTVAMIAGRTGNASEKLQAMVRWASLNGQARFMGHRIDVPELLAASDVFVFPSLYEGLGGALIEAMALGLPIVASDLPAIREVVEDGANAVLVPAGSPSDLEEAIATIAADADRRRRMGERSRQIFLERFTLERSARRMVELFERVAAAGRR